MDKHYHIEVSSASIFKVIFGILLVFTLYLLQDVVLILLYALVIASAVSPFATWFEQRKIPRLFSVLFLYIAIFSLVVVVSSLVLPSISTDLNQLTALFPKIIEKLSVSLDTAQLESPKYFDFASEIQNILDTLSGYLQQFSQSAVSLIISVFGGIMSFVAIIIISFYLSMMRNGIELFLKSVLPRKQEAYAIDLWKRAEIKVGRWLQGQMLLGLIVGLVVFVGLSLMKIKFALVFGILAMLLEIVPIAGPVLSAIPAVALGFLQDPTLGLWMVVFYVVVQQIEGHVLVPIVLGRTVGLNPAVVVLSLLIGMKLAGIAGAILAVPVASVIVEVLEDLAKHRDAEGGTGAV